MTYVSRDANGRLDELARVAAQEHLHEEGVQEQEQERQVQVLQLVL